MRVRYNFPSIYEIVNKITGKSYYGQAAITSKRWSDELWLLRKGKHHSTHLQNSFNKYGEKNFGFCVVMDFSDVPEELRKDLINEFERRIILENPDNYNMQDGGRAHFKLAEETLAKLRPKRKEMWQRPGFREMQQQHQLRVWGDPTYQAIQSDVHKQSWEDPEIREKHREGMLKFWASPENRERQIAKIKEGIERAKVHGKVRRLDKNAPKRTRKQILAERKLRWES